MSRREPVILTIAGSDSGGGAGIQADLRAFWDHGVHGASAITAITAQHTAGVTRIDPVPVDGLRAQVEAVLGDLDVAAVKLGMLGSVAHAEAVADLLAGLAVPVVVDPVLVATSRDRLSEDGVVAVYRERLLPLATLATPNLPEAAALAGAGEADVEAVAELARAVLVTGGDADGDEVVDVLAQGTERRTWRLPRLTGGPFHGTGCTLASAVAARLARGEALEDAVDGAIRYVRARLSSAARIGRGAAVLGPAPGRGPVA